MADITNARAIHLKGALFVLLGALASAALLVDSPRLETVLLLAVAVWAFARGYYYAFYVLERYVDPTLRYSGLLSLARHALTGGLRRFARRDT